MTLVTGRLEAAVFACRPTMRKALGLLLFAILLTGAMTILQAQTGERKLLSSPAPLRKIRQTKFRPRVVRRFGVREFGKLTNAMVISTTNSNANISEATENQPAKKIVENPTIRMNWFLFQRTFPNDTLPSQGRFAAFDAAFHSTLAIAEPTPAPMTERWKPIGPTPITASFPSMGVTSGRVGCIAVSPVDPQIVLIGGATGGLWRSTNGGNNFVPVSDDQVDLAVGSLAFAPSNPSIVYAGMGDAAAGYMGTGVLKSLNGGQSWRRISGPSLPAPGLIANLVVEPTNSDRVYITQYTYRPATGEGEVYASGFFLSTDGGANWQRTLSGLPTDLVHHPTNPNTLYIAMETMFSNVAPSAGVYKSVDGGTTWQLIFAPAYLQAVDIRLAVSQSEPDRLYVLTGGIVSDALTVNLLISKDAGSTWTNLGQSDIDFGQFGYNSYVAVDPSDPQTIYIGTRDLFKSTNGGLDWVNLTRNWTKFSNGYGFNPEAATSHSDQHAIAFVPSSPGVIYIGNDGGLSRSQDGGETFQSLNNDLSLTQFNSVTMHPTEVERSCGGTQDNGALVRSVPIDSWREFISGDSGGCLMNPLDPSVIYSGYIYGTLYRFRNNGEVFDSQIASEATFLESPRTPRIGFYPAFTVDSRTGDLYFGTWRVFASSDRGNNWQLTSSSTDDLTKGETKFGRDVLSAIAIDPKDSSILFTGSAQGRVMMSRNKGASWKDVTNTLPKRFVTSIRVDPATAGKVYVTLSGFGSGHVFRSLDSGAHWTDISPSLPNIPVNSLLIDPVNNTTLYSGTDVGVFRSVNGGPWHTFNRGMPPVIVTGFSAQSNGALQAATYGRGAYELVR
jgi:photosystem II stability/assembly factor-like uncharacterized protein